jgi:RimJ/RimL family protein N-acetyltransferase
MVIRPVEPSDRQLLVDGFERLSPESRYRRFFAEIPRLTERQLDYLTNVDQHDHVALIAIDESSGQGIGVARFVRTGAGIAEPAIVVVDDWQRQGVGSALLDRLVERAREEGIGRFVAPVLAENLASIRAFERLGDTTIEHHGAEVELTVELPEPPPEPGSGIRRLLRAVAAGAVEPALVIWHRLLPRRGVPRDQLRNVFIADDGEPALGLAGEIAAAVGASLVVAAARAPLVEDAGDVAERLERTAAPLRGRVKSLRTAARRGDLGAILLDEAITERARLIVVSDTGGDETIAGRLLGSVWGHVSHHAPCDVLIAREPLGRR